MKNDSIKKMQASLIMFIFTAVLFSPLATPLSRNLTTSAQPETDKIIVNITRPLNHSFYMRNIRLFSRSSITFVYGPFIIAAKATSDEKIRHVNFYVNGILRKIDFLPPYTYDFTPITCFRHRITVRAFDAGGNTGSASITVFCWRMHPLLLLGGAYVLYRLISSKR
jgi:Bacterial Ig domain